MKLKLLALAACISGLFPTPAGAQETDAQSLEKLDSMLVRYTAALERQSTELKSGECDFLISSVQDSLTSQHVALWLYSRYKDSPLMGDEAVAIHIYDKWIKSGIISMRSDMERFDAELFASFNRATLLGNTAPAVVLRKPCTGKMSIPLENGRYSIFFFYDTGCSKCALTAEVLPGILDKISFPADFYAVYCGQDRKSWRRFRHGFKLRNKNVKTFHLWDPDIESDYLRLYGVISTPKIYVADTDGEIIGRRLEAESLEEIIYYICAYYGQAQEK